MKKLLLILAISITALTGCLTDSGDCVTCTGYSAERLQELNQMVQKGYISYETYANRLSKANNCTNTVCNGSKHCYLHN